MDVKKEPTEEVAAALEEKVVTVDPKDYEDSLPDDVAKALHNAISGMPLELPEEPEEEPRRAPLLVIDEEFMETFGRYHRKNSEQTDTMANAFEDPAENLRYLADTLYGHRMYLMGISSMLRLLERAISETAIMLVPEKGWPGPNKEAREAAEKRALIECDEYQVLLDAEHAVSTVKDTIISVIQSAEDARRSLEYSITSEMVQQIRERNKDVTRIGSRAAETHIKDDFEKQALEELGYD